MNNKIRLKSSKGRQLFDDARAASAWIVEYQPSWVSVARDFRLSDEYEYDYAELEDIDTTTAPVALIAERIEGLLGLRAPEISLGAHMAWDQALIEAERLSRSRGGARVNIVATDAADHRALREDLTEMCDEEVDGVFVITFLVEEGDALGPTARIGVVG